MRLIAWFKSKSLLIRVLVLFVLVVFLYAILISVIQDKRSGATTDTYNASGTWTAPAGVTSVTVQAWGGGGAGGGATGNPATGGGGAGGAYATKVIAVTPSNGYTVTVGTGGGGGTGDGGPGLDSWFSTSGTIVAKGGAGGISAATNSTNGAGASGSCTGCIGDTTYAGGGGSTGDYTAGTGYSGAGGGSAGSSGAGGSASAGTGGTAGTGGGNGANGVGDSTAGATGNTPGGAGSGGKANGAANRNGGDGAAGRVLVTYNAVPNAPTLSSPTNASTITTTQPVFNLRSSDLDNDYLRYKIEVCSTSNCSSIVRTIDQTASQTGWSGQDTQTSTAYVGNSTESSSTMAVHTYQTPALSFGTQYWWRAYAIDPAGFNTFSSVSSIFTFTTTSVPAAPTLNVPADAATNTSQTPQFEMRTTDADNDYLRYKIEVCSTSNCSSIVRTIDQTASQTGWSGQDTQGSTAYIGNSVIGSSTMAVHVYQATALSYSTQYWWRAYGIDPAGSNTWSSASAIRTFTTLPPPSDTYIQGGTIIRGGTRIGL